MKNKQLKLLRRYQPQVGVQVPHGNRHPLLSSWIDEDRISCERELLLRQLNSLPVYPGRDFSSCYFAPENTRNTPLYATSHAVPFAAPSRSNVVHVYPSTVRPDFSRTQIMTFTEQSSTTRQEQDGEFKCYCGNCKTDCCSNGFQPKSYSASRPAPRDNIMRFADQETMTPKYGHVCCGSCDPLPPCCATSEVSISTSELSFKKGKVQIQQTSAPPILKHSYVMRRDPCCGEVCSPPMYCDVDSDTEDLPDICPARRSCSAQVKVIPNQSCANMFKPKPCKKTKVSCRCPKKIYDSEVDRGFCNLDKHNCFDLCKRKEVHCRPSRCSVTGRRTEECIGREIEIPFSHRGGSKYHSHCRESAPLPHHCELKRFVASPRCLRKSFDEKTVQSKPVIPCKMCLPKRVLTSEQDIEAFLGKHKHTARSPSRCFGRWF